MCQSDTTAKIFYSEIRGLSDSGHSPGFIFQELVCSIYFL